MDRRGESLGLVIALVAELATLKLVEPNMRRILATKLESQY